jgi:hypothetical protein
MNILSAEFISANKRERISSGVYITSECIESVKKDDYFLLTHNESEYYFQVSGIKTCGDMLDVTLKEVGYWCKKLDHKGIDLRHIIGLQLVPITDASKKAKIDEMSCWC